jgi:DNA-binding NarL/FixJ family response regulator
VTKPRGRPRSDDLLTPAEWRVLEGVRHGMSNPEIARR